MPVTIILSDEQAAQLTEFLGGVRVFTINPQHAKAVSACTDRPCLPDSSILSWLSNGRAAALPFVPRQPLDSC
jgi:hypothetical protein